MGNSTNRAMRTKFEKSRKQAVAWAAAQPVPQSKAKMRELCSGINAMLDNPETRQRLREAGAFQRGPTMVAYGADELQRKRGNVTLGDSTEGRAALLPGTPYRAETKYLTLARRETRLIPAKVS